MDLWWEILRLIRSITEGIGQILAVQSSTSTLIALRLCFYVFPPLKKTFCIYKEMLNSLRKIYLQNQDRENKTALIFHQQIFLAFVVTFRLYLNVS